MAPIASPDDLLRDPHLEATGFFAREHHPSEGEIRSMGIPVNFSRTPGAVRRHAPRLDEHGEEIRRELDAPESE
jgi:crotonobetainyl-CoA:carnitine CoA-transferase CaiB-like acyl-CoA transferase